MDSMSYVQPQHPFWSGGRSDLSLCMECISNRNEVARTERKAELAAAPRCALCKRRGTMRVGQDKVLLCGHHYKRAMQGFNRRASGAGGMALFLQVPSPAGDVLSWAKGN